MTIEELSQQAAFEQRRLRNLRASALQLHNRAIMRPDQQALLDAIQRLVQRHQEGTVHEGSLYRRIVALHFLHSKKYHH